MAVHHVGVTVSDIGRSLAFYAGLLAGDVLGPYERRGPSIDAVTGQRDAVVRQAFVRSPDGEALVELLQYVGAEHRRLDPDNATVGSVHVAVLVEDVDVALARLVAAGTHVVSDPITASPPLGGFRCVYVLDPDDVRVELVQLAPGVTSYLGPLPD